MDKFITEHPIAASLTAVVLMLGALIYALTHPAKHWDGH